MTHSWSSKDLGQIGPADRPSAERLAVQRGNPGSLVGSDTTRTHSLEGLGQISGKVTIQTTLLGAYLRRQVLNKIGVSTNRECRLTSQPHQRAVPAVSVTLSSPTDTDRAHRVPARHARRIWRDLVRTLRCVRRGAGRT